MRDLRLRLDSLIPWRLGRLALPMWLAASLASPTHAQAPAGAAPPPSVIVELARKRNVADQSVFTGRVQAIDKVTIRARVAGFIKKRGFEEGTEVDEGQLLFQLEKEPYEAALALAEANHANAQAALELAEATYNRTKPLAERGTSSQAALDQAVSQLDQAKAAIKAQEANVQTAKLNLGYTEIRSPLAGAAGRATYSVGEYVGPSSDPLVTIVRQDPIYVAFPVPQRIFLQVRREGVSKESVVVRLKLPDGTMYDQDGTIAFSDVETNPQTDTVTVRATFPNPKRLLVDQQIVGVQVEAREPEERLVISQSAVILDQQGAYVLVVDKDNKVEQRRVKLGDQRGPEIIVQEGLKEGDRVIVSGQQKVRPGIAVDAQVATDTLTSTSPATP
ncbi:MAG TPA: efflux RND transporter periplasmic adaptor subunit [Hyphomicrobium sp.]|nr:efflux RND transporter periplasmic adaptor subunit [Hyphomicrobium sp.]